ncbi:MAG TPA: GntR family transcriptional regulator [Polyangiaceae bacterium LLY-WYZ-15_(1-7)]|nr:GntR family transcriptional regulator [Myxococcales bacterium]MAT23521.1 GntR family transcriptional regulator [Sandaracinus sp.]HJL02617.1 GntR family transcriptional regulator [Polyangiaceae bacterium LLY-WYZ-15_(1-7)]MBJ73777.1 GntR family transcriptional regulator [Sandaracinus sp.]HJL11287.1 GntR family transcriptional regulator [Polyangiaceae bacterium LLY-WYZ-15_(1-7)]
MVEPPIRAVTRRSLSEAVFQQLRDGILSGALAAGTALPSERALCERFGVNRAALREALKRLQQLRLVAIRQGESTRVLDFRETGGLELLVGLLLDGEGNVQWKAVRSFVEMRTALGPDIARLAALRRGEAELAALDEALAALEAEPADDVVALQRRSLALWRVLVRASDNLAYQLAFNTMERAWEGVQDTFAPALADEVTHRAGYRALVRAVRRGQPEAARKAAARLVARGAKAAEALLGGLVERGGETGEAG